MAVFFLSYLAFSLSAICGGGAGLMLIPVLGQMLPVSQVPAALSIGTFTSSASRIIVFYAKIRWDIVRWFVPAALPAVWLGAWLLRFVNPLYLEIAMGLFLVSNLPFVFRKPKNQAVDQKTTRLALVLIGFSAGFVSGLTGAVGLLFNQFYLRYGMSKEEIVATRAANEIVLHLIKIVLYTWFGLISMKVVALGVVVAAAALLSTYTMKWVLPRVSEGLFRKIGYSAMVFSGVAMLTQSGSTLLGKNNGYVSLAPVTEGMEAKLQWQNAGFAFEFTYDEGFEYEQVTPLAELPPYKQQLVLSRKGTADRIVVETVYAPGETSYEAYYFKDRRLIGKIDFQ